MSRCNGTGHTGHGPMTGRGAGCCGGNKVSRHGNGFSGRAMDVERGFGLGRGFGFGNENQMPYTEASEKSRIETAINALKNQLQYLEKRRDDMGK